MIVSRSDRRSKIANRGEDCASLSQSLAGRASTLSEEFNKDVPNLWSGVPMKTRVKLTKPAATREQVYVFAHGCIERGEVECGEIRGHLF